jgi:hypothetical protein
MIRTIRCLALATGLALVQTASLQAGPDETTELLRRLPGNMSACLVMEDLSPALDRLTTSPVFAEWTQQPIIQRWVQSPSYRTFQGVLAFLPIYFGVDNRSLLNDFIGSSVVMTFRPKSADSPAVGIIACRATKIETLDRIMTSLCRPLPDRQIDRHEYRGHEFFERREFGNRHDCILRLGSSLFVSDKKSAIEQIIDTQESSAKSLFDTEKFRIMREKIKPGAVVSLLIDPNAFEPLVAQGVESTQGAARPIAQHVAQLWKHLSWVAVTLHAQDDLSLAIDAEIDPTEIASAEARLLEAWTKRSLFWDRVPADALLAASSEIDFVAAMQIIGEISHAEPSLSGLVDACSALSAGFDAKTEILPSLGPEVGLVLRADKDGSLLGVLDMPLRPNGRKGPMGLTLAQSLEMLVFRPLLIFYASDHNQRLGDQARIETQEIDQDRLHLMTGSIWLPEGFQPGFSVNESRILITTSPKAYSQWNAGSEQTWPSSPAARRQQRSMGDSEVIKAYLNFNELSFFLRRMTEDQSSKEYHSKISDLVSVLSPFDFATLSASRTENHWRTTLTLFPKMNNLAEK